MGNEERTQYFSIMGHAPAGDEAVFFPALYDAGNDELYAGLIEAREFGFDVFREFLEGAWGAGGMSGGKPGRLILDGGLIESGYAALMERTPGMESLSVGFSNPGQPSGSSLLERAWKVVQAEIAAAGVVSGVRVSSYNLGELISRGVKRYNAGRKVPK